MASGGSKERRAVCTSLSLQHSHPSVVLFPTLRSIQRGIDQSSKNPSEETRTPSNSRRASEIKKKNLLQGMWWLIDGAPHCCPAVLGLNPASPNKRAYYQSIIGLSHANQFKKDFRFYKKKGGGGISSMMAKVTAIKRPIKKQRKYYLNTAYCVL